MSDPIQAPPAAPKRRGRPPKPQTAPQPTVVLTPEEKRRLEWEDFSRRDVEWQSQQGEPCPHCGQYPGYNPVTGIQVRSWTGRKVTDGHRDSCPMKDKAARKV